MNPYAKITTVKTLATLIRRAILKGDASRDNEVDLREVMRHVRDVSHAIIRGEIFRARNEGEKAIDGHYIATYRNVPVLYDAEVKRCYSVLPAEYMSLPNDMGIQSVRATNSGQGTNGPANNVAMIPIPNSAMDVYGKLMAGTLEGQWSFEVERDKIWYNNKFKKNLLDCNIKEVMIKQVIISPEDVDDNAPFPLPPELRTPVIQKVLELYQVPMSVIKDTVNDNNPNLAK